MLPRERVLMAIEGKEPDQVPLGLGGITTSGITLEAYENLLNFLGHPVDDVVVKYPVQRLAKLDEEFLMTWGVDVRDVAPRPLFKSKEHDGYVDLIDEWGLTWRRKNVPGAMFYPATQPLRYAKSADEVDEYPWPNPENPELFQGLREEARRHWKNGYAVVVNHWGCGIMELSAYLRGYDQFFLDLASHPEIPLKIMDKVLELKMRFWDKALSELLPYISVIKINDDLGGQDGLLISPNMYRKYTKPRHKALISFLKRKTGEKVKILFHSCGAIEPLIADFIDLGIDILNPVQISCAGMDPHHLKRTYGSKICFWGGGVDTQKTLPLGSPEQVKEEVKHLVRIFAPGGGFIFAPTQSIDPDVPPENIVAMLEAFNEVKAYGL